VGTPMKRTHGTGTVIARTNGTYTAQISDGGRRSIGTFPSRAAAEKSLAIAMVKGPPLVLDLTFGEYLSEWLADVRVTTQDAVEEDYVMSIEMDLGCISHQERRAIRDRSFPGECSRLFDRPRPEVDARGPRGASSQRSEGEVTRPTPEVENRSALKA
jgi:hypothetical protein